MRILTIYDGTLQSKTALQYGLRKVQEKGGELIVVQVFQSSLFIDYGAGPRAEEIARAESARHRRDAEAIISAAGLKGVTVRVLYEEGDPVAAGLHAAEMEKAELILASPRYKAIAKKSSCPVYVMPGTILVPIDSSEGARADRNMIVAEARATGSKVVLLGIVPVHLYSTGEQEEVEQLTKRTSAAVKKTRKALSEQGIQVEEAMRAGYPDEEILKAAEELRASVIMLPGGGKTPSELTKAAAILIEEPQRVRRPVWLLNEANG